MIGILVASFWSRRLSVRQLPFKLLQLISKFATYQKLIETNGRLPKEEYPFTRIKFIVVCENMAAKLELLHRFRYNSYDPADWGTRFSVREQVLMSKMKILGKAWKEPLDFEFWVSFVDMNAKRLRKFNRSPTSVILLYDTTVNPKETSEMCASVANMEQSFLRHEFRSMVVNLPKTVIGLTYDDEDSLFYDEERRRVVSREEGEAIAKRFHARYFEVNTQTGGNVDDVFMFLIFEAVREYKKRTTQPFVSESHFYSKGDPDRTSCTTIVDCTVM